MLTVATAAGTLLKVNISVSRAGPEEKKEDSMAEYERKTYSLFSKRLALCKLGRYAGWTPEMVENGRTDRWDIVAA